MRTTKVQIILAGALVAVAGIAAESSSVGGPLMGYVVRPEVPELRAMLGVPGAARFSDALALPDGTLTADVAPGHAWVLATRSKDTVAFVPATQVSVALPGGVPAAWVFSPSGSRMAMSFSDRGEVVLLSGLPSSPKIESTLKIAAFDSIALSDSGTLVYSSANQLFTGDGQFLYASDSLGLVAFEATRDSVVLFDIATSSLVEVGVPSASSRVIAAGITTAPDSLFAGSDRIYAGNSAASAVSMIEYADGSITAQNVTVSTRIAPSAVTGTILTSFDSNGPAWLVSAQGMSFVPAIVTQAVQ